MKRSLVPAVLLCVLLAAGLTSGCGVGSHLDRMDSNTNRMASELENDRQYIQTLSEQIKNLAESLAMLQKMSASVFNLVVEKLTTAAEPAQTPNIDDVIKGLPVPPAASQKPQQ